MGRALRCVMSALPLLIVSGLLYCAVFIKPTASGAAVVPPAMGRGDLIYGVAVPSAGTVWAVGTDGKVWKSADAAASWQLQRTPVQENLQDIAAWSSECAVAVGNGGVVIRTCDSGASWQEVKLPRSRIANKLIRVRSVGDAQAWTVGEAGAVFLSNDLGATWSRKLPEEDNAWNDISIVGSQLTLVGEFGRIRQSTDGGTVWRDIASPVKTSLMAITFRDASQGVAVGLDGVMLATVDGGATWRVIPPATREHLFDVVWDGKRWVAVGDRGAVIHISGAGPDLHAAQAGDSDRAWHTRIAFEPHRYYLAGSNFRVLSN